MQMSIIKITHVLIFTLIFGWGFADARSSEQVEEINRCSDQDVIYTIQEGDNLYNISKKFGSYLFWESIYIANADNVSSPDLIYPGQLIKIPHNVAGFTEKNLSLSRVLKNPFCKITELPYAEVEERYLSRYNLSSLERLASIERNSEKEEREENREKERLAENREIVQEEIEKQERTQGKIQRENERQLMMEIDGMVHDETRSKVGRDFYSVFYSYWQSPPDAYNFSIRVSEQPSPNIGTTILVEVNDTETFKMRLQPRYEMIREAGKYAVQQTYNHLQNNPQGRMIY